MKTQSNNAIDFNIRKPIPEYNSIPSESNKFNINDTTDAGADMLSAGIAELFLGVGLITELVKGFQVIAEVEDDCSGPVNTKSQEQCAVHTGFNFNNFAKANRSPLSNTKPQKPQKVPVHFGR